MPANLSIFQEIYVGDLCARVRHNKWYRIWHCVRSSECKASVHSNLKLMIYERASLSINSMRYNAVIHTYAIRVSIVDS